MKIYLGSDHAGFELKEDIKSYLQEKGDIGLEDVGTHSEDTTDYPRFAQLIAEAITKDPESRGILFCRSGEGMAIAANRTRGIRACIAWNSGVARESRNDNDCNVLSLPAGYLTEQEAQKIVDVWLVTPASKEERHINRNHQLDNLS